MAQGLILPLIFLAKFGLTKKVEDSVQPFTSHYIVINEGAPKISNSSIYFRLMAQVFLNSVRMSVLFPIDLGRSRSKVAWASRKQLRAIRRKWTELGCFLVIPLISANYWKLSRLPQPLRKVRISCLLILQSTHCRQYFGYPFWHHVKAHLSWV